MEKGIKVFLDDYRSPIDCIPYMYKRIGALNPIYKEGDWYVVRNYPAFVKAIDRFKGEITHVSFDHDLAEIHYIETTKKIGNVVQMQYSETTSEKTGYDCALWMKNYYAENNIPLPIMFVHSMNPVGTENIINLFK